MRQLINSLDLLLMGGRFLIKSYSIGCYNRKTAAAAIRKAENATEYIHTLLRSPGIKVEIYHWRRYSYDYDRLRPMTPYRKRKWVKIAELES